MSNLIEVKPIDVSSAAQAQTQADLMLTNAQQTAIINQGSYEQSGFFLKTVKEKYKHLDTMRKNITQPLDAAKKAVMDLFRRPLECLEQAESIIKRSMIKYEDEQERIRQDNERKLQADAEKKRLDALKKAEEARSNGNDQKAEKYENKAASVVAPVLATRVNGVSGIARKKVWKYRIIDEKLIPREFLCIDEKKLGEYARAVKGTIPVAGVEFYEEDTLAARV